MKQILRPSLIALILSLMVLTVMAQPARPEKLLISGGLIIDGTGTAGRVADLRIDGDRIVEIGNLTRSQGARSQGAQSQGERTIDARGLVIAPGFIDIHNHSERGFASDPSARSQILQGITTLAVGPDGGSPWPIADYLLWCRNQKLSTNVLAFIGHATVRRQVLGDDFKRVATPREVAKMAELVERAMKEGAIGLSSGLEYDVGNPATTEEVIALARVAGKHHGIYMSHVRDEADLALDAFREAIRIGREAEIPVQISHIKLGTVGVWGKAAEAIRLIDEARRSGVDVTADCYPYDAWSSTITVLVPSRRHDDPVAVKKGLDDVGGAANILVTSCRAHRDFEGMTLDQIASREATTPVDAYIKIVRDGGAGVVCKSMKDEDIRTFYRQPWVMVSSDGGIGMRHPRGTGTFPRVLGRYVRDQKWLSLEEAVHKMTALPADRLGLQDRGRLRAGMKADLVIFDPLKVIDRSTMTQPFIEPVGVTHVFVNGIQVVSEGSVTGQRPGEVLSRKGRK